MVAVQEEAEVLHAGIARFGDAPKLHMMLAQLQERQADTAAARRTLQAGLKHSPKCVPLWLMLARLEERQGSVPTARAILEQARLRIAQSADLWCAAVRTEARAGNAAAAAAALTRALQDCADVPGVGKLWALHVTMAERNQRRARMEDALRKAGDSPHMFAAVGQRFLEDRKYDKARKYFQRATALDGDIGDFWGMWVACEEAAGAPANAAEVLQAAKKVRQGLISKWLCPLLLALYCGGAHAKLSIRVPRPALGIWTLSAHKSRKVANATSYHLTPILLWISAHGHRCRQTRTTATAGRRS